MSCCCVVIDDFIVFVVVFVFVVFVVVVVDDDDDDDGNIKDVVGVIAVGVRTHALGLCGSAHDDKSCRQIFLALRKCRRVSRELVLC